MKNLILLLVLLGAVGSAYYFGFGAWNNIQVLNAKIAEVDNVQTQVEAIKDERDKVLERYRSVDPADLDRLEKLFPSNGNLEEAYVFFQTLFGRSNVQVVHMGLVTQKGTEGKTTVQFTFEVKGGYSELRSLLASIENNIRLMEAKTVTISLEKDGSFNLKYVGSMFYSN